MNRKINSLIVIASLIVSLLVACQSAQERLHEISDQLPLPESTKLFASRLEESQGSQDACFFTSLIQVYGSNLSYEAVKKFYISQLPDQGWAQQFPSWLPNEGIYFKLSNEYQLAADKVAPNDILIKQFESVDNEELGSYSTIYVVTITYADWIARRGCPAWNDEV